MGLKEFFKFKKWVPDTTREPPAKADWPEHVITLNNKKFDEFIEKYPLSVIDFWAPWCQPCKNITPKIRQLSKMYKGKVAFGKLNVDKHKEISRRFHILAIPNLLFFSYGEKISNITGVRSFNEIQNKIEDILAQFKR